MKSTNEKARILSEPGLCEQSLEVGADQSILALPSPGGAGTSARSNPRRLVETCGRPVAAHVRGAVPGMTSAAHANVPAPETGRQVPWTVCNFTLGAFR